MSNGHRPIFLAAWGIYVGYLLFLMGKLARLKKEAAALGA
jgi:hypothetical protein